MNPLMSSNRMFRGLVTDDALDTIFCTKAFAASFLRFEIGLTHALAETGSASDSLCDAAAEKMAGFTPDFDAIERASPTDGMAAPEYVRQLKSFVGAELAQVVHQGVTSQDLIDTAMSLCLKRANDLLDARLQSVLTSVDGLMATYQGKTMQGRTRMQAALPIRVTQRLRSWRDPLQRHRQRLSHLREQVEVLQFGGPVGDRSKSGPHADKIAERLAGKLGLTPAAHARHAERDGWADYAGWLSLVTGSLGKIGQDICLMSQQGIDEISQTGGGSSSAMAHKQNPVGAEMLVTLAHFNAGQLPLMHQALIHEQERSGARWTLEWMTLPSMVMAAAKSLQIARLQMDHITRIGPTV